MRKQKILKLGLGLLIASSSAMTHISANDEIVATNKVANQTVKASGDVFWDDANILEYLITAADEVEVKKINKQAINNGDGSIIITIPDTIANNGTTYKVTSVGEFAFNIGSTVPNYTVTIGANIRDIKEKAFSSTNITGEIKLPSSVRTIADYAFAFSDVTKVTLNEGLVSIGANAFERNQIAGNVTIPNSVTSIGANAFDQNKITGVTFGSGMTVISRNVFTSNMITSIDFNSETVEIGKSAFHSNSLKSIDLSNLTKLKKIDQMAFAGNGMNKVILPQGLETIGFGAFNSSWMDSIIIPASVKRIDATVFSDAVEHIYFEGDGTNLSLGGITHVPGFDNNYPYVVFPDTTYSIYAPTAASIPTFKSLFNKDTVASYENTGHSGEEILQQIPQDRVVLELKADYFGYAANTPTTISKRKGESTSIEAINAMTSFGKWNTTREAWDDQLVNLHENEEPVQWYKDGKAIVGQTAAVLNINNIKVADAGKYYAMADGVKLSEITLFINEGEMISADDFSLTLEEATNLTEAQAKLLSNVKAWDEDDNSPIAITSVDISKVKAEQGVYDVTFATAKGKSITVKAVVGENIAYYAVDGNDVTMTLSELKTQVSNGTLEQYVLTKSNAKGTKRDINGVSNVPVKADVSALKNLSAGDATKLTLNADTSSSIGTRADQEVVEAAKEINIKIVDEVKKPSINTGDQTNLALLTFVMIASAGVYFALNKYKREKE